MEKSKAEIYMLIMPLKVPQRTCSGVCRFKARRDVATSPHSIIIAMTTHVISITAR